MENEKSTRSFNSFPGRKKETNVKKESKDEFLEDIDVPVLSLDKILDMICDNIVISNNNNIYRDFLNDLQKCKCIGIASAGFSDGCKSNPSLIAFNLDNKRIVILDLLEMKSMQFNPFQTDLMNILKSKNIEKIMHCSKYFVDYLSHHEHILISRIFDTQLADLYLKRGESDDDTLLLYTDCLIKYLRIPERISAVHTRIPVTDLKKVIYKRPLDDDLVHFIAYNAGFLINLRKEIHSLIIQPFLDYLQKEVKSLSDNDTMLLEFTDVLHNCI